MRLQTMRLGKVRVTIAATAGPLQLGEGRSGVNLVVSPMAIDTAWLPAA
jgi:hypothetical protein